MTKPVLDVGGLAVGYEGRAVMEKLRFSIGRGEFVGIMGAKQ